MPHRSRHNRKRRGIKSSANKMVRMGRGTKSSANRMVRTGRGSGRNRNTSRTEPTPSNGMFGLPATFTMDTNIVNDVMIGGSSGPNGDSGLLIGPGGNTGHFKIVGIDIDDQTGDMEMWPDDDLAENIKAWFSWTIDTGPDGLLLCPDLAENEECLHPDYSSVSTWVYFGLPSCTTGQCIGPWKTFSFDPIEGDVISGTNNGIYTAEVTTCEGYPDDFCPVDGGIFSLENCIDFSGGTANDVCNDQEGTWYYKKHWDGTIGYMAGGSNTQYLVTLLANGKARFGKANPTSGTIYGGENANDAITQAGPSSALWTLDGGQFELQRWHPSQINNDTGMVFPDQLAVGADGTKFTANLTADLDVGIINFTNGTIVDWNNNNGSFEVGNTSDIYPAQLLEAGGFDIQDGQPMSILRYMLSTTGQQMRPEQVDYTLYQDGTYGRSGSDYPGTWQVKPQQGIIEITSTYQSGDEGGYEGYDIYTSDANSLAEGLDISLNGNSMYDYGIQAGRFKSLDGSPGYWYSLPMIYGHGTYETAISYDISDIQGGNLMQYFPTNPGDTHKVWQCNYHSWFESFACVEEQSTGAIGNWNIIGGNINTDGSILGPAYTEGAWARGYWESSNVEGAIAGTHTFTGTATWTHQYSSFTLFDNTYDPWENEYYLIPDGTNGYQPITWNQTRIGGGIPGDVNMDGNVNIQDIVQIVNVIMGSSGGVDNQTQDWFSAADVNGDGTVNVLDVIVIMNQILNNTLLSSQQSQTLQRFKSCIQSGSDLQHCSSIVMGGRNVRRPAKGRRNPNRTNISRGMSRNNYQRGGANRRTSSNRTSSNRKTRSQQTDYKNATGKITNPRGGKNF